MAFLLLLLLPLITPSVSSADAILGEYFNERKEGKIEIYRCKSGYCGRVIWRHDLPRKDVNNPDPALRDRSILDVVFMYAFQYDPKVGKWVGGKFYSLDTGGTYRGKAWLEDEGKTLKLRGYWGSSVLGKTATLYRVE